ncbi:hypothetical protein VTK73DRAFT_312 [Phialemonium thermophilum]|uniref:Cation/H+ exchanger transmembrane domain-containing protein n=1 Tax=Phialemonium thermophilum TaxID=223376 RepID=A0ABR3VVU0_9PEZI
MILPFGLGCAIAYGLYHQFRTESGLADISFGVYALFIGTALAITAFPVLCRILTELKLLRSGVGVTVLAAGVGNDVTGWILLALCVALVNSSSGLAALWALLCAVGWTLLLVFAVKPVFLWALRRTGSLQNGPTQGMVAVTLLMVLISAWFTGIIGIHPIFGAFLVGLICPHDGGFAIKLTEKIEDLLSVLFLPLYFALSGLSTNLGLLDDGITWAYVVGVIAVAFCGKIVGGMLAARFCGLLWRESAAIGVLMSCKGLVELIVLLDNRTKATLTFSSQVLCRTGTKTLNEALTILLNGPVHDAGVQSLGGSAHQVNRWLEIMKLAPQAKTLGQKKYLEYLLADILDGYVATVDCPAITLTPELMALFPDAVVIATTRDEESWWKSMSYVNDMMANWYIPLIVMWVPKVGVYGRWRTLFGYLAHWRYGTHTLTRETLKMHEDHLRAVVPPEKLFWYNVADGWEPLCKILDVPVPDRPFPHNNSKASAAKVYRDLVFVGLFCWAVVLSCTGLLVWALWGRLPASTDLTGVLRSTYRRDVFGSNGTRV